MSAVAGLGLARRRLGATPAPPPPRPLRPPPATPQSGYAAYAGSSENAAANKAFFEAVMKSVAEKRAANPGVQAVTVIYNTTNAPSFRSQIASSTSIWNSSVSNVKLQEGSNADFAYREGNDSRGSYASTDGHGSGYIFLDYAQNQQYDSTRVTAHETGHVLGLPDHYTGPCSELMSGGGPGTSCTQRLPERHGALAGELPLAERSRGLSPAPRPDTGLHAAPVRGRSAGAGRPPPAVGTAQASSSGKAPRWPVPAPCAGRGSNSRQLHISWTNPVRRSQRPATSSPPAASR